MEKLNLLTALTSYKNESTDAWHISIKNLSSESIEINSWGIQPENSNIEFMLFMKRVPEIGEIVPRKLKTDESANFYVYKKWVKEELEKYINDGALDIKEKFSIYLNIKQDDINKCLFPIDMEIKDLIIL